MLTPDASVVVENYFGDTHLNVISSSLTAFLHATADIAVAGLLAELPYSITQEMISARADQIGWEHWPYDTKLENDLNAVNWPQPWREARGLPPP